MRLGILTGTFNPIHMGHMALCDAARTAFRLDRVVLVPAGESPLRRGAAPAKDRLRMARLAADDVPYLAVSTLETDAGGFVFSADTVEKLAADFPGAELFFLVGSDTLLTLKSWVRSDALVARCGIVCLARDGETDAAALSAKRLNDRFPSASVTVLDAPGAAVSGTCIRERMLAAKPIAGLVPPSVERYLYESGLYYPGELRTLQTLLKARIRPHRYVHTMGVVRTAADLAERWGCDPGQARLAALLHDCAKYLDPCTLETEAGDDTEIRPVYHAFAGAVEAKNRFGVTDEAVLRAIRRHTTGESNMSVLDCVTYLADMIEPNRDYPGVEELRELIGDDPFEATLRAMEHTLEHVSAGGETHPASIRAYHWLKARSDRTFPV